MNTPNPNPLIPQGTFLQQKARARTNLRIAVGAILAIHGVLFTGLLMQAGCKREARQAHLEPTNALPIFDPRVFETLPPEPPPAAMTPPAESAYVPPPPPPMTVAVPEPVPQTSAPAPTPGFIEYSVKKGDSFYTIAKAHGITVNAIAQANPGVNPARLQIGQKLVLPAPSAGTAAAAPAPAPEPGSLVADSSGAKYYVVKSGDTLTSIARKHGTTINALKTANNLATDRLLIGQKLKVPAGGAPASQASQGRLPGAG